MAMTFEISGDYGYVVLVLAAYIFFNFWMAIQVLLARERYNVDFPTMYALESENKDAKLFNCIQVSDLFPLLSRNSPPDLTPFRRNGNRREGTRTRWR